MLAFVAEPGQGRGMVEQRTFSVVAVTFFGKKEVGRFATREQAEWHAKELNEWSERNPRGYVQYLVRPTHEMKRKE
jgi:hypothetical protein